MFYYLFPSNYSNRKLCMTIRIFTFYSFPHKQKIERQFCVTICNERCQSRSAGVRAGRHAGRWAGGRIKYRVHWEGMCQGTRQTIEGGGGGRTPIRFRTYNTQNRRNGRLESALRGMSQANANVGVFQETKLME